MTTDITKSTTDSAQKPTSKILALAIPLVFAQIGQVLVEIIDSIMIGKLGATELASATFSQNIQMFIIISLTSALYITSNLAAQRVSRNDKSSLANLIKAAQLLIYSLATLGLGVLLVISTQLPRFGQPLEVTNLSYPYFILCSISSFAAIATIGNKFVLDGTGYAKASTFIIVGVLAVNAALNGIFMFGWLFDIKMGLTGAGVATLISRFLGLLFTEFLVYQSLKKALPKPTQRKLFSSDLMNLIRLGTPVTIMVAAEFGAFTIVGVLAGHFGEASLASHRIAISITGLTFLAAGALSQATGIVASHHLNNFSHFRRIIKAGYIITTGFMLTSCIFIMTFRLTIPELFISDPNIIAIASQLLLIIGLYQLVDGQQLMAHAALRALEDTKVPGVIVTSSYWFIAVPTGYALAYLFDLKLVGLWVGLFIGISLVSLGCFIRYQKIVGKKFLSPISLQTA